MKEGAISGGHFGQGFTLLQRDVLVTPELVSLIPNLESRGKLYKKLEGQKSISPSFVYGDDDAWNFFLQFYRFCLNSKAVIEANGDELQLMLHLWGCYFERFTNLKDIANVCVTGTGDSVVD